MTERIPDYSTVLEVINFLIANNFLVGIPCLEEGGYRCPTAKDIYDLCQGKRYINTKKYLQNKSPVIPSNSPNDS